MKKILIINLTIASVFFCATLFSATTVAGQPSPKPENTPRNVQGGQFQLETGQTQKDPYESGQDLTITFLQDIETKISQLASGSPGLVAAPDERAVSFLAGLYLFCVVRDGVCPFLLDTILEADIINARQNKNDQCPIMRGFWKTYITNDMENRHQFLTKLGHMGVTSEFNRDRRPGYIKCQETVKNAVSGGGSDSEFFKSRYSDPKIKTAVSRSLTVVSDLKSKGINVFREVETRK